MDDLPKIAEQMAGMGTALAGLILVFLGTIVGQYDSFDTPSKNRVKVQFRNRALIAFLGLASAVATAAFGFSYNFFSYDWLICVALACLIVALLALVVSAIFEIGRLF